MPLFTSTCIRFSGFTCHTIHHTLPSYIINAHISIWRMTWPMTAMAPMCITAAPSPSTHTTCLSGCAIAMPWKMSGGHHGQKLETTSRRKASADELIQVSILPSTLSTLKLWQAAFVFDDTQKYMQESNVAVAYQRDRRAVAHRPHSEEVVRVALSTMWAHVFFLGDLQLPQS
jgi:hypothetical protein